MTETTYNLAGMASTRTVDNPEAQVETEAGDATVNDLVDQMTHRQE